jgi:hypothetical protein
VGIVPTVRLGEPDGVAFAGTVPDLPPGFRALRIRFRNPSFFWPPGPPAKSPATDSDASDCRNTS